MLLYHRSAGACPPRSQQSEAGFPRFIGLARLGVLVNANVLFTVARGPVPRDLSAETTNVRSPEATDVCCHDRRTARDRPSPYGPGGDVLRQPNKQRHIKDLKDLRFIVSRDAIDIKVLQTLNPERKRHGYRSAGARPPRTFDSTEKYCLERSAGACPPRSLRRNERHPQPRDHGRLLLRPRHGEGQALALR